MKTIDLRSDTITLPTEDMRRAIYEAELGDDVYQEDPTINRLEEQSARIMGKEAALLTVSGAMSNLIAVLAQTRPGDEIVVGDQAHMLWYEVGSASALGGVVIRTVPNEEDGRLDLRTVEQTIRAEDIHFPRTTLLGLENTHNRCGGTVLTPEYTTAAAELAHQHGIRVHLDGARIFNAAVALGVPASELAAPVDSVCFCLSKSLSAPVGSLLCGTCDFVASARKWRKMLGGGMRQAGIIAAAGIVALDDMIERLAEDHANARLLAQGLARIPAITVNPDRVRTNIVIFDLPASISTSEFIQRLGRQGVKVGSRGGQRVRAVTHRMVEAGDIQEALKRIELVVREMEAAAR
ncbi:MAG: low-specificity L-threonine aldolase [Dehalococcoidia bacterium]|nr:low-specificity L-threonine aldolase [Chloroflexota bacterium]MCK4222208.1 low-specificity L-threonine aldolase [Dehalococcoidia bacterium]